MDMGEKCFKKTEMMEFKDQTTGEKIVFPVGTVYGKAEGPTLVVIGGMHGSEFCGIQGAIDVFNDTQPEDLAGTLIVCTIYNMPAFQRHLGFLVPQDGKNPMSTFPGAIEGSYGEVMAYHFNENILKRADYVIELHGGDIPEALTPFVIQSKTGNQELDAKIQDMARIYNIPLIIQVESKPKEGFGSAFMKTVQRGIPAILTESGQQGILNMDDALVHTTGIKNVMKHLGMIEGDIVDTVERVDLKYNGAIRNEVKGIWYPFVRLNQKVEKDEVVGEIRDYFGVCLKEIKAPINGLVTVIRTSPSVDKGNVLIELHHLMND